MDEVETQALTQLTHAEPLDDKVGFLLVEGYMQYPIKKGVTMIGRDQNKCDIVLDDDSVSKVHAVIRIKKASEFFLIDMNSTNGTKCKEIPLKPQFPTQFHYDEKIEFGSVFALLRRGAQSAPDDECHLPMTQVLDTPARHRPTGNTLRQLTIPESPNVSDKDDSFLMPSRPPAQKKSLENNKSTPKNQQHDSKESSNDSLFWKAPSRSPSLKFDLDESSGTINDSGSGCANIRRGTETSIHEMETQLPYSSTRQSAEVVSIYDAETQIHTDEDVVKKSSDESNKINQTRRHNIEIHEMETQLPYSSTRQSAEAVSIYDAETQIHPDEDIANESPDESNKANQTKRHIEVSESDEEIMCEEFDTEDFEVPNSQAISIEEVISKSPVISETVKQLINSNDACSEYEKQNEPTGSTVPIYVGNKIVKALHDDDDSTDCEDEHLTCSNKENVTNHNVSSMNITATCSNFNVMDVVVEESDEEFIKDEKKNENHISTEAFHAYADEISEVPTQVVTINERKCFSQNNNDGVPIQIIALGNYATEALTETTKPQNVYMQKHILPPSNEDISDALTQVINPENDVTDAPTQIIDHLHNNVEKHAEASMNDDFCDAPTQIIDVPNNNLTNVNISDALTQVIPIANDDNNAPSRVMSTEVVKDSSSPFKVPMKAISKIKATKQHRHSKSSTSNDTHRNSPARATNDENYYAATQDIVADLQSQEEHHYNCTQDVLNDLQTQNNEILFKNSSKSVSPILSRSSSSGTDEINVKNVSNLSPTKIRDIVGAGDSSQKIDVSDLDDTPRKEFDFDELPLSEDISQHRTTQRTPPTVISSEEEDEPHSSKENSDSDTPIVFRKKKRINKAKVNLTKRLDPENLPSRISTRMRKPTEKMKKLVASIEPEERIEAEIIKENLAKLKGEKGQIVATVLRPNTSKIEEVGRPSRGGRTYTRKESPSEVVNIKMDIKRGTTKKKEFKASEKSENVKEYTRKTKEPFKTSTSNQDEVEKRKDNRMNLKPKRETKSKREIEVDISSTDSEDEAIPLKKRRHQRISKKKSKAGSEKTKHKKTTNRIESSTESDVEGTALPTKRNKSQRKTKDDSKNDTQKQDIQSAEAKISPKRNRNLKTLNPGIEFQNSDSHLSTRRSNRQKNNDSDSAKNTPIVIIDKIVMPQKKSKNKDSVPPKYDQSLAYSMIEKSDSSVDSRVSSPQLTRLSHRKRGADSEVVVLTPSKKLRSSNTSITATQHSVLFTAYDIVENRNLLQKLGAEVVEDPKKCTVVVTKQVKRTIKFLCAVSLGRPIVGDSWVQACRKAKELVDPWPYLLEDADSEKKFKFSLRKSLQAQRHYLAGYSVTSTPKALPPPHEIKVLVECSGGKWKEGGKNWIVISNAEDRALWPSLRQRGAVVVSNEFILSGVLKQAVDLQAYKLAG